ncbi:MAG: hypothetical protein K2F68_04300 [Duncaniella sp.]|nr:hypothetical protein [Duncaniella sp.]
MNKKHIATLIAFLSLTSGLSLRQPHDILSYQGIDEWGYYTVRFLVDQEGLILMAKAVTNLSPDIDEEMERCILGLPQLTPATFGEKKYPATGTLVIEYEIEKLDEETKEKYLKKKSDSATNTTTSSYPNSTSHGCRQ